MSLSATGKIKKIFDERHIKEGFNIREFVLTIGEETSYPQDVVFQMVNSNCDQIIGKRPGDKIEVFFNLRGKYGAPSQNGYNHLPYNRLEVWRIHSHERE